MYEDFLRKVPLFADLPDEDLTHLCQLTGEVRLSSGQVLFYEGSLADTAYILYQGKVEIVKNVDGREIFIDLKEEPGTVIGEMALLEEFTRLATVRARGDARLLSLTHDQVHELLNLSATAAKIMLHTLTRRWRGIEAHVRHNEKMAQLGMLTAGIAHEMNNPVTAVLRSAAQLQTSLNHAEETRIALERLQLTAVQQAQVAVLAQQIQVAAAQPATLNALTRGDSEAAVETWLDTHTFNDAWELAPVLVTLGLTPSQLDELADTFTLDQLSALLHWIETACTTNTLLTAIGQGAARMAGIVSALKSYVYLDQAPIQNVDIHAGLDDTLVILRHKLQPGIIVQREYGSQIPKISAYASELNQVWTNIIDNATDALNGQGMIIIRTRQEEGEVVVEIEDNGPGIPPTIVPKLFDPFFTTKPPGKGAGLGLNIAYNIVQKHHGEIAVVSVPGQTVFQVRLPLNGRQE
ncbi:MAG TPA: ATP-binding protein [Chloroflexota bacterium]|nr:ATP-binding protein [Chloroflexota bacterium]